jgi:hypothetical protein
METASVIGQDRRIDFIGLGQAILGAGKIARAAGVDHADGQAGGVERGDKIAVVPAGGLADDLHGTRGPREGLDQRAIARGGVGDGPGQGQLAAGELDLVLGHIGPDIDRGGDHG